MAKLEEPFYVERIGSRWARMAVSYRTLEAAITAAKAGAADAMQTRAYDCTEGPVGKLVATF